MLGYRFFIFFIQFIIFSQISAKLSEAQTEEIIALCVENQVLEHISEKIATAQVETDPFPHLIIEGILPEKLYEAGVKFWPSQGAFYAKGFPHDGPVYRRHICTNLGAVDFSALTEEQRVFWRAFGEIVANHYIKPLVIQKMMDYVHYKFPFQNPVQVETYKKMFEFYPFHYDALLTDTADYFIDPHVDGVKTFAQCLLYFPPDNNHQDLGTKFFYGPPYQGPDMQSYRPLLRVAKHVRFKRNTLVVFLQSPTSWHSAEVSPYNDRNYLRKMFLLTLRTSPESTNKIYGLPASLTEWYYQDFNQINPR